MRKRIKIFTALLAGAFLLFSVSCENGESGSQGQSGDQGDTGGIPEPSGLASNTVSPPATPESDFPGTDTGSQADTPASDQGEDPVWIRVNGESVYKSEVKMIESLFKMQFSQMGKIPAEQFKRIAMMNSVQMELLNQAAKEAGIEADPAEVQQQLDNLKQNLPGNKGLSSYLQKLGLSEEQFRELTKSQLVHTKVLEDNVQLEEPTDEDIQQEYENQKTRFKEPPQVKVKHIMLSVSPAADQSQKQEKKEKAESVRKKIAGGEDFMELAEKHSDFGGAEKDVVRTFKKGTMPEKFDKVAFNLEEGKLSPVIETDMGYHIVKVMEKTEAGVASLEDVREKIIEVLKVKQRREAMSEYMEKLKSDAEIEYVEPLPEAPRPTPQPGMQPPKEEPQPTP